VAPAAYLLGMALLVGRYGLPNEESIALLIARNVTAE
jgi:hypothetical protein